MSTVFQVKCLTHDARGPKIRRTVGLKAVIHAEHMPATADGQLRGQHDMGAFLVDHEFCELVLERGP